MLPTEPNHRLPHVSTSEQGKSGLGLAAQEAAIRAIAAAEEFDIVEVVSEVASGKPFIVAELGADVDPFVLHLFAALGEKNRR